MQKHDMPLHRLLPRQVCKSLVQSGAKEAAILSDLSSKNTECFSLKTNVWEIVLVDATA